MLLGDGGMMQTTKLPLWIRASAVNITCMTLIKYGWSNKTCSCSGSFGLILVYGESYISLP